MKWFLNYTIINVPELSAEVNLALPIPACASEPEQVLMLFIPPLSEWLQYCGKLSLFPLHWCEFLLPDKSVESDFRPRLTQVLVLQSPLQVVILGMEKKGELKKISP